MEVLMAMGEERLSIDYQRNYQVMVIYTRYKF